MLSIPKFMRLLFIILCFSALFSPNAKARLAHIPLDKIDDARYEAIYYREITDSLNTQPNWNEEYILQIGKNYSLFLNYGRYQMDSLYWFDVDVKEPAWNKYFMEAMKKSISNDFSVKDLKQGKYAEFNYLPLDNVY